MPVDRKRSRPAKKWRSKVAPGTIGALVVLVAVPLVMLGVGREPGESVGFREAVLILAASAMALLDGNLHLERRRTAGAMLLHWIYALPTGIIAIMPWLGRPGLLLLPGATLLILAATLESHRFIRAMPQGAPPE